MTAAASPFASASADLIAAGFTPIPLIPHDFTQHAGRGKCPAEYRSGAYQGMGKWQRFRDSTPSSFELGLWSKWPGANVGVIMGSSVGRDMHVGCLDFDASDPDVLDTLLRSAPASPMVKRGQKGETRFYLMAKTLKTAAYDDTSEVGADGKVKAKRLIDLLTGFDTRQTVVPPSIHPDTGQPYVWLKGPVRADELPRFDEDDLQALEEALETCGWVRGGRATGRVVRSAGNPVDDDDLWSETKAAALANLSAWVPALDLYGCRPARGGYEAVAHWRASSTGRAMAERKLNLSVQATGIKDFGTNDTYSAIDLVMAARDVDHSEATTWLRERLGLDDTGVVIELAGPPRDDEADLPEPLRNLGPPPEAKTPPPSVKDDGALGGLGGGDQDAATGVDAPTHVSAEMPAHLLECPGLVGELAAWMDRTAQRPLPAANLLAALSVVGTAAGRRFAGPTESSLVLFGLALAPSGSGKDHPIRAAQFILRKADLGRMVAPSSWMSGSALVQHLGRQPVCVSYADEVGEFFAKLNGAKSSTHERAISGVLRELFGINWGSFTTPGWASSNAAASTPPAIHAPAYSFIGFSVPEAVWSAMQGSDVTNGFLNRFLLMPTAEAGVERDDPESVFDVPEQIVTALRAIGQAGGALAGATMHADMASEPLVRVPWDGGKSGAAATLFKDLRRACREHPHGEHLMKRTAEIAVRLATIRAIGRAGERASVTLQDMEFGRNLALFSAERMIADASAYMSETEWQAKAKFVLRCIADSPSRRITRTALCKKVAHRFPARDLDAILKGLKESEEVADNSSRSGHRGPAALTYVAL